MVERRGRTLRAAARAGLSGAHGPEPRDEHGCGVRDAHDRDVRDEHERDVREEHVLPRRRAFPVVMFLRVTARLFATSAARRRACDFATSLRR
jgi:hypothetical protein